MRQAMKVKWLSRPQSGHGGTAPFEAQLAYQTCLLHHPQGLQKQRLGEHSHHLHWLKRAELLAGLQQNTCTQNVAALGRTLQCSMPPLDHFPRVSAPVRPAPVLEFRISPVLLLLLTRPGLFPAEHHSACLLVRRCSSATPQSFGSQARSPLL